MIYRRREGEVVKNGFNWDKDRASTFILITRIWRFCCYFRIRSPFIMEGNSNKRKYIFDVDWQRLTKIGRIEYDFVTKSLKIGNHRLSLEQVEDYIERENRRG